VGVFRFVAAAVAAFCLLAGGAVAARHTAAPLPAGAVYVSPSGNDADPGTLARPWRTLRHALQSLRPGSTLIVRGGTYSERLGGSTPVSIRPGTAAAPVLVRAYPGERPVLQGLLWLSNPSYWTIDGLDVTWRSDGAPNEHMVKITNGVGWRVTDAEFWGAHSYADLLVAGTASGQPANWRVDHSCIHDTVPTNQTNQDHNVYVNTGLSAGAGSLDHDILFGAPNGENVKLAGPDSGNGTANVTVAYDTLFGAAQPLLVGGPSTRITIQRNLIARPLLTYVFRGYQLTGRSVVARDNLATGAPKLFWNDGSSTSGILDGGGNQLTSSVAFDSTSSCAGFNPRTAAAQLYGARAAG
jgi:hypothetical protein